MESQRTPTLAPENKPSGLALKKTLEELKDFQQIAIKAVTRLEKFQFQATPVLQQQNDLWKEQQKTNQTVLLKLDELLTQQKKHEQTYLELTQKLDQLLQQQQQQQKQHISSTASLRLPAPNYYTLTKTK
jgi:hypothetical protein